MSKRGPVESLASLSRTTRPITCRNKSDNLSCSWCSRDISPDADHVVLSPCQCTVCPKCLLFELAPRGNSEAQCHCCSSPICSHQYFESRLAQLPKAEYQKPTLPIHCTTSLRWGARVYEVPDSSHLKRKAYCCVILRWLECMPKMWKPTSKLPNHPPTKITTNTFTNRT